MGKSSSQAPGPDPQIGEAALKQAETGEAWLEFAENAYAQSMERQVDLDALTTEVTQQQLGLATDQANWAREDRDRYNEVFKPVADEFVEEAANYATEERQDQAAAEAKADVQKAAATAKAATERQSASLGIDPTSGRFKGIQAMTDMNQTLAEAGAMNTTRQAVRDKGLALKADVANLGSGYSSAAGAAAAGSVSASGTALAGNQASNAQALNASTIMNSGYSGAMQGYAGQADTLSREYGLQLQGWQAQQQANAQATSGLFGGLGQIAGAGLAFFSDEKLKEEIAGIPDGSALDAVRSMPVTEWKYKEGVADEGRHVGPMAQDFHAATGRGDGHMIPVQDAIGVTMAAVQDLADDVDEIKGTIGLGQPHARSRKPAAPVTSLMIAIPVEDSPRTGTKRKGKEQ